MSESSTSKDQDISSIPSDQLAEKGFRYLFADVEFNESAGTLVVGGKAVSVEPRPLRLLAELLRRINEVVTKDELFEAVWSGRVTVDHVLANAVSKLRGALGEQGGARIVTLPRLGYRLDGPMQRIAFGEVQRGWGIGQPVPGREGYVLERSIGAGSASQVWLARHAKLGQARVFKFAADEAQLAAIKREYTLFRVLQAELGPRDDFVRVLDTQFATAPQFIECEYGGANLLEWAEADGRLAASPVADRLALFLQIARTVAAAHSVGVLHKDLKPANVLVADEAGAWKIRLTDFGSGRLLDPDQLDRLQLTAMGVTQKGLASGDSNSGTLMYLAPELQAGQSATTQSDVYALGLMLYQMVAGDLRRPLASGWEREIADPLLREDIRAATDGKPHERIQSVAVLVERLSSLGTRRESQLAAERAAEQAARVAAQVQRFKAQRPWMLAAVVSLALGAALSVWFAVQERASLKEAEQQKARADAINEFMSVDLLSGVDVVGVGKDGMVSIRAVLARAADRAGERFNAQPRTEALVRGRLADLYFRAGMYEEALGQFRLAFADDQDAARDPALLTFRFSYAVLLAQMSKPTEAQSQIDEAEKQRARLSAPAQAALEGEATQARFSVLAATEKYAQALPLAKRVVELLDQRAAPDPLKRFNTRMFLADMHYRLGQFAEAQTVLATALQSQPLSQIGVVPEARAKLMQARVRIAAGQTDGVEAALVGARDVLLARMGPDNHDAAAANVELGGLYDARGDFARASDALQAAYTSMSTSLGAGHSNTRIVGLNLAISEVNAGRAEAGLQKLEDGRAWFAKNMGGDDSAVVQAIDFERARALTTLSRASQALPLLDRLKPERLAEATPARDWAERLQAERGRALMASGRRDEGLRMLRGALPQMASHGSSAWVIEGYRRLIDDKRMVNAR